MIIIRKSAVESRRSIYWKFGEEAFFDAKNENGAEIGFFFF